MLHLRDFSESCAPPASHASATKWLSLIRNDVIRDTQLYCKKSNNIYVYRLHKVAIIRPYVSENTKIKLYTCSDLCNYKLCGRYLFIT